MPSRWEALLDEVAQRSQATGRDWAAGARSFESGAPLRIVNALVDGMDARARYAMDPEFHAAIKAIAQIAAAAAFDRIELTREEMETRRVQFERLSVARQW